MTSLPFLLPWLISAALLLLFLAGGAILFRWQSTGFRDSMGTLQAQQTALTTLVAELQAHIVSTADAVPLSVAIQTVLVKELTHFHMPEVDALLAKLGPPFTLTDVEEAQLLEAMQQREHDMGNEITDSERDAAHMLPFVIKRVRREAEAVTPATENTFQVVSIPTPPSPDGAGASPPKEAQ